MKTNKPSNDKEIADALSIKIYDYQTSKEISKQQIQLKKHTFSFLLEGKKEVFFDNSNFSIDKSSFLLMKSGHCLMTETPSSISENYRSILLLFSTEEVINLMKKYDLKPNYKVSSRSTYSFRYDSFITGFVNSLITISKLSPNLQGNLLQTKFEEIMLYLIEVRGANFLHSFTEDLNQNQRFIETIESNVMNKLTVKELAFLSNMSISTFKRTFEKNFQSSPSKWFQDKRLEQAALLLDNDANRPSDIFEEIGYENLSNFIQAFKTKFGITPKQYQLN